MPDTFRHSNRARLLHWPVKRHDGFTLVELLVAMSVLLILVLMMASMTSATSRVWRGSRARVDAFQASRNAFERITAHLRQATLATYFDYYNSNGQSRTEVLASNPNAAFTAANYDRASELQLVCGQASTLVPAGSSSGNRPTHAMFFQAPLGYVSGSTDPNSDFKMLDTVLNGVGFYLDFTDGSAMRPGFISSASPMWRYRLMELYQPSQNLGIYFSASAPAPYSGTQSWFNVALNPAAPAIAPTIVVADNIVALIFRPETAAGAAKVNAASTPEIAPTYAYDTKAYWTQSDAYSKQSKNQLPPMVRVTMVAIDADSATRLAGMFGTKPPTLYGQSPFVDVTQYDTDLAGLESVLRGYHLAYHVFVSDVSIPEAQWSQVVTP